MSATAVFVVFLVAAGIYAAVNMMTRIWKHSGRDPVNPFWSSSQWDPNGIELLTTCTGPSFPGNCIIEGVQHVSSQGATRTCVASVCIDFDGENVKGNNIPFQATCDIPYCSWSQCFLTFDAGDRAFVAVDGPDRKLIVAATGTIFYMQRQTIDEAGNKVSDQNGTLAQFFVLPTDVQPNSDKMLVLGYTNTQPNPVPGVGGKVTQLQIGISSLPTEGFLDIFLLLEALPQSISPGVVTPPNIVPRKILTFGGDQRTSNPPTNILSNFVSYEQQKMWKALNAFGPLRVISWQHQGFYGLEDDDYVKVLNSWTPSKSGLVQDALETRLQTTGFERPFYNWL